MKSVWAVVVPAVMLVAGCQSQGGGAPKGDFKTVSAITARCTICHGDNPKPKMGIDLRTYASMMKGGKEGPIVKPGDPAGSVLVQAVKGLNGRKRMPFNQPPLSDGQIQAIEEWIKAGAKEN